MTSQPPFRVGILEDNIEFALYLGSIIALDADLELAFHAETIAGAKATLATQTPPNIMLIDMQLPDGLGLEIVEAALKHPSMKVLMLTVLVDRQCPIGIGAWRTRLFAQRRPRPSNSRCDS